MSDNYIDLIIADDSNIVIECFKNWISDSNKIRLIDVAHKKEELEGLIKIYENAIILGSFPWIIKQGKLKIGRILVQYPNIKYALCLNANHYKLIHALTEIGIKGFFGDVTTKDELIKGLCDLKKYNFFMAPDLLAEFIDDNKRSNGNGNANEDKLKLTNRETEILEFVLRGKSSKDIARLLNISKRTVDGHRANINNKFGVRNTAQLYQKAASFLLFM
jgi:DNA-binding NarL/FixJ family response regulator